MTSPAVEISTSLQLPGTSVRAKARWMARAGIVGLAVATVLAVRVSAVLDDVPNRHALTDDASRTARSDAAGALVRGDVLELVGLLFGSETGFLLPAISAPAIALAGSAHALDVEVAISLVFTALLFVVLGLATRCVGRSAGEALIVLAIATPILMGNRDLFGQAASGTLDMPSAVFTLAAAVAWLASRHSRTYRPWALAFFGNALFHVRFEDGLMLGLAVFLVEAAQAGWTRPPRAVVSALFRGVRNPVGVALLAVGLTVLLGGWWLASSGGVGLTVFGRELGLRDFGGPVAVGVAVLFVFVEYSFWRERVWLSAEIPRRARFLWNWLLTPMIAWILVPFTGRLQALGLTVAFDADRSLLSLPRAVWEGWIPSDAHWIVVALLCGSILAAFRSATTRLVLLSLGALVLFEIAFLTLFHQGDLQPRLIVPLAPLMALCAAAWVPAVPRTPRVVIGAGAAAVLLWTVLPLWRSPELVATLSRGFQSTANGPP